MSPSINLRASNKRSFNDPCCVATERKSSQSKCSNYRISQIPSRIKRWIIEGGRFEQDEWRLLLKILAWMLR